MTGNGKAILALVNESTDHMTAEQVFEKLKEHGVIMSLATVYNNLNSLADKGEIVRLRIPGQPDRFDKIMRHDHLVCRKCGKISDMFLDDLTDWIKRQSGVEIEAYDLRLLYTCEECKNI